jgi:hypothetical protein
MRSSGVDSHRGRTCTTSALLSTTATTSICHPCGASGGRRIAVFYQDDAYGQAGLKGTEIAIPKWRKPRPARWLDCAARLRHDIVV